MTQTDGDRRPDATSDAAAQAAPRTHFGARDVAMDEKPGLVRGVFASVASRYDVMNDLMSARAHRLWKEALIDWIAPRPADHLLDLAGGTGDVTFRFLDRLGGAGEATVCDFSEEMLAEGRRRAAARDIQAPIHWIVGDAMALPFEDGAFDKATISFGIRNVARPEAALSEIRRVLRPGGRFICLEFSRVRVEALRQLYDAYSFAVIPRLGQLVAGDRDSYQYLVESIRNFPDQESFAEMMTAAGFSRVTWRNLTGGVVAMHSGWRL